ncbi:MAG: hypothetical protein BMS9Abin07_2312 [Acidimicrobiia bacterium]|nr:MAG: hypothetical protein BMS9Abin07_2312 [Acidimicrobiia bacterium]
MSDPEPEAALDRPASSIEAAATAGLVFAVLYGAVLLIFIQAPGRTAPADDIISWYSDPGHRGWMVAAFNLAAFSAVAFLWFVGVIRKRVGAREDQFFATVFLGSAILFVALMLVGLGLLVAVALSIGETLVPDAGEIAIVGRAAELILVVAMPRMQAVFIATTSTIGLRTGALARWLVIVGYLFAALLTLAPIVIEIPGLGFGLWVALVSASLLVHRQQLERLE